MVAAALPEKQAAAVSSGSFSRQAVTAAASSRVKTALSSMGRPARRAASCQGANQPPVAAVSGSRPVRAMSIIRNSRSVTGLSGPKQRAPPITSPEKMPSLRRNRASNSWESPAMSAKTASLTGRRIVMVTFASAERLPAPSSTA